MYYEPSVLAPDPLVNSFTTEPGLRTMTPWQVAGKYYCIGQHSRCNFPFRLLRADHCRLIIQRQSLTILTAGSSHCPWFQAFSSIACLFITALMYYAGSDRHKMVSSQSCSFRTISRGYTGDGT